MMYLNQKLVNEMKNNFKSNILFCLKYLKNL